MCALYLGQTVQVVNILYGYRTITWEKREYDETSRRINSMNTSLSNLKSIIPSTFLFWGAEIAQSV
jgi:hypothetical protein